jgi:hypothetical protein
VQDTHDRVADAQEAVDGDDRGLRGDTGGWGGTGRWGGNAEDQQGQADRSGDANPAHGPPPFVPPNHRFLHESNGWGRDLSAI